MREGWETDQPVSEPANLPNGEINNTGNYSRRVTSLRMPGQSGGTVRPSVAPGATAVPSPMEVTGGSQKASSYATSGAAAQPRDGERMVRPLSAMTYPPPPPPPMTALSPQKEGVEKDGTAERT